MLKTTCFFIFTGGVIGVNSRESIISEIKKQGLPFDELTERQQKALLVNISMKMIYEPITKAVSDSFKPFEKELLRISK